MSAVALAARAEPAVRLAAVDMVYRAGDTNVTALQDVNLEVGKGEFVTLIGPSGCGKSTILRLVGDILKVSAGRITVGGTSPVEARLNHQYAFVFQEPVLLPWRNLAQNVALPLEVARVPKEQHSAITAELLRRVGLQGFGERMPQELSGGMRMRASLARALTGRPDLLLMDEPFGALDEITRLEMNEELLRVWESNRAAVLFVTHSIDEAVFLSDRVVVLSARPGRIIADIPIALDRPRNYGEMSETPAFQDSCRAVRAALYSGRQL